MADLRTQMRLSVAEALKNEGLTDMTSFRKEVTDELEGIKHSIGYSSERCEEAIRQVDEVKEENKQLRKELEVVKNQGWTWKISRKTSSSWD